ncbi:hypothetical protein GPJ56_001108 [Histomonas meleagridis]|uniref:uncharacterized protein n=1 Tax=Histomonas meleagridis TaxID=135588 RepID=UPI003559D704|nr:hypothetical protein GPJ56_001108 [Histomonas meleagridis]KAH0798468.1 hypothetical protein GO595_008738 [Histomonas meleagridis]
MKSLQPINQHRNIDAIYTIVDGYPDIIFSEESQPVINEDLPRFMQRYTPLKLSIVFKAIGCQAPLNQSLSEWAFTFLRECPSEAVNTILGNENNDIFTDPRRFSPSRKYIVLSRIQFHRLISASLYIHQFRKVRYSVDFRLALDFIEERRFFIILLSGAPGTGKSTIASLLASSMSVCHILSTDSIRHSMRSKYPKSQYPILHCSTYECGDIVDPDHLLSDEERCLKGYLAQSELVGTQLTSVISSFVKSRTSLIVEGVHLSVDLIMKLVREFLNVVPFLIYIKKEDFHRQRFAVRAKYMTTDPSQNRYISNFPAIRLVQRSLSQGASQYLIPKIDNRNIDRSLETMHQTLFSYLKKQQGRPTMFDPKTQKLTFLNSVWRRRKQKLTSKTNTLKAIKTMKNAQEIADTTTKSSVQDLLNSLVKEGMIYYDDISGSTIKILPNGTMYYQSKEENINNEKQKEEKNENEGEENSCDAVPIIRDESEVTEAETEDPAEITLTDFLETTDSEYVDFHVH